MSLRSSNSIKERLGKEAALLIEEGMLVGLGSGSTASCFIESLGVRCKEGLKIRAVSSSVKSLELASAVGVPVIDIEGIISVDLTVDGADEVDPSKRMIKGGGGAHVREKILASMSRKMVVIVDESKVVKVLGACGLPVEILPFGSSATIARLNRLGFKGTFRLMGKAPYVTDNGNLLFDITIPSLFPHPEEVHASLVQIPGVVDTGFFFNLASFVLIGHRDGRIEKR